MYVILRVPYCNKKIAEAQKLINLLEDNKSNIVTLFKPVKKAQSVELPDNYFKKESSVFQQFVSYTDCNDKISIEINHIESKKTRQENHQEEGQFISIAFSGNRESLHSKTPFKDIFNWLLEQGKSISVFEYAYNEDKNLNWFQPS
tara:strand:- start:419 stop:856 length:438 start_codon:yes stop_codon:yes gene_type:complete